MLRTCLLAPLLLVATACGDDGGDLPIDAGGDDEVDAPVDGSTCDRTRTDPCPMPFFPGMGGYYQASGPIAQVTEHVYTVVPTVSGTHRLAGTSSSGSMAFSLSTDVSLTCTATGAFCLAFQPCSGVDVPLTAGTTYYVKVCNSSTSSDLPYNVFVDLP